MSSLQTRLRAHAAIPLYRSAYALMSSVAATSALGFLFWAIASRAYSAHTVGVSSAAIAALTFLTGIGSLFLDGSLYRFLPRAGQKTDALLRWAALTTTLSATAAAAIFVAGIHVWAPDLSFVTSSPWTVFAAIGSVVVSCLLIVNDGALIGFRRAGWVPIKGIAYGVAKLVVLAICVDAAPRYGIVLAWIVPSGIILATSVFLMMRRIVPAHRVVSRTDPEPIGPAVVTRYAAGNYVAFLCNLAYRTLPPLLVIHELGPTQSAYFFVPWQILTSLVLLTNNLSVSLVVEGSLDPTQLALQTRRSLRQFIRLLLPLSLVLLVAAPWLLQVFGAKYAAHGASLLRLLALGLIPASISIIAVGVARVRGRIGVIIATQVSIAVLVVGLGAVFLHVVGLTAFGISWLIAQTAAAYWLSLTELRPVLKPRPTRRRPVPPRIQSLEEEVEKFETELRDAFAWLETPGRPS